MVIEIQAADLTPVQQLLSTIQNTALSTAIRRSDWAVMALEAVHLLGLALLGGAACLTALAAVRRTGLRGLSLPTLAQGLRPLFVTGFGLMTVSGAFIVLAMPFKYYLNAAFRIKMLLLAAAVAATAWLLREAVGPIPLSRQRALAVVAALIWLAVGFSGRLIGFL
jgi:hypothetical protein